MTGLFFLLFDALRTLIHFLSTLLRTPVRLWNLLEEHEDLSNDLVDVAHYGIKLQQQIFKMEQRLAHLEAEKGARA